MDFSINSNEGNSQNAQPHDSALHQQIQQSQAIASSAAMRTLTTQGVNQDKQ